MFEIRRIRGLVLAAILSDEDQFDPDPVHRECVYVVGRRLREVTGGWLFNMPVHVIQPYSVDFHLSFHENGRVDPKFGYGPEAYAYEKRYLTAEGRHK